ncbi:MAG: SUMF1/EgtB/PvdO family nonheme iron enzyme [Leptospiraceae bacterium]|nr:SUMF1/EgtB/PvdO family nonheme iron enzyme [Leptospiraceae bacterium]
MNLFTKKYLKRILSLFSFVAFIFYTNYTLSQEVMEDKESLDFIDVQVWEGEVVGVYKNEGKIRVTKKNPDWEDLNFEETKQEILKTGRYLLKQKGSNIEIGHFEVRLVELETYKKQKKKPKYIINIRGKFIVPAKYKRLVTTDLYIGGYQKERKYVSPNGFQNNRVTEPKKTIIHPKDKKEMVFVPKGYFLYGQGKDADLDSFNPNFDTPTEKTLMDLPSFYIDKYEVTNLEYYKFLKESNKKPPYYWKGKVYPKGKENHPVHSLTYREVEQYASWSGKKIPTEFQWEKAARGSSLIIEKDNSGKNVFILDEKKYPFGNNFDPLLCNTIYSKINDTVSVYELSPKGASVYGAIGMCGNVAEWTRSWYKPYNGHFLENPSFGKQFKVIRGGAFYNSQKEATSFYRDYGGIPNLRKDRKAGFRLVMEKQR